VLDPKGGSDTRSFGNTSRLLGPSHRPQAFETGSRSPLFSVGTAFVGFSHRWADDCPSQKTAFVWALPRKLALAKTAFVFWRFPGAWACAGGSPNPNRGCRQHPISDKLIVYPGSAPAAFPPPPPASQRQAWAPKRMPQFFPVPPPPLSDSDSDTEVTICIPVVLCNLHSALCIDHWLRGGCYAWGGRPGWKKWTTPL